MKYLLQLYSFLFKFTISTIKLSKYKYNSNHTYQRTFKHTVFKLRFFTPLVFVTIINLISLSTTYSLESKTSYLLNESTTLDLFNSKSLTNLEIENSFDLTQLSLEQLNTKYNLNLSVDLSLQKDQTDSLSSGLQQDNFYQKHSLLLSKRFLTGTTWGLELGHLKNETGTFPSIIPPARTYQNYFSIQIDQPLFPYFFGAQEKLAFEALKNEVEIKKNQIKSDYLTAQKEVLVLFWKTKSLAKSVEENNKLISEYEKLSRKVQQKKQNQFASAGELEQALSEYENRKQALKDDQSKLNQNFQSLKSALNVNPTDEIRFDPYLPKISPFVFKEVHIGKLQKYKNINLKLKNAELQTEGNSQAHKPQISIYGRYTQSGLDLENKLSLSESLDPNHKKYLIGLKLDYTFNNDKNFLDQKIKRMTLRLEQEKFQKSQNFLFQQIQLAQEEIKSAELSIYSNLLILDFRKKAVQEISKNYFQGRTDINFLIDAYNKKNQAEINLINSYGNLSIQKIDYQILTLE